MPYKEDTERQLRGSPHDGSPHSTKALRLKRMAGDKNCGGRDSVTRCKK